MARRIQRAFEAMTRRMQRQVRVGDLQTREYARKETIVTPGNIILIGALSGGYIQLCHKRRGPAQILDYSLSVYTRSHFCVMVDGTDYQAPELPLGLAQARWKSLAAASRTNEQVGIIFDRWMLNYYHWMVFCVPKLILLSKVLGVERLFMPSDLTAIPSFVWQTLELLSLQKEALVPISSGIHHADELCFVHGAWPSPFTCQLTRRKLCSGVVGGQPPDTKQVFLLRNANTSNPRALVNESEVLQLCAQMGIKAVDPGALTLREQIALFQNVDLVIAVHGAALANMLWMRPGSRVIEIATGMQPHYKALAEQLGISWLSLLADNADPRVAGHSGMFVLNVEALEKIIHLCAGAQFDS